MTRLAAPARIVVTCGVAVLAVAGLAACSSSSSSSSSSSASSSASPTTAASLPAPIIVAPGETTASAKVGETVVFNVADPTTTKVASDNTAVLDPKQGYTDGSAVFNPGGKALSAGTAVITITAADGSTSKVTVTVTS